MHWVVVYGVEPHPLKPDDSPYSGDVWQTEYSKYRQPTTHAERVANAHSVSGLSPAFTVLIDDLAPRNSSAGSNPVWCSYGPAPNAGGSPTAVTHQPYIS